MEGGSARCDEHGNTGMWIVESSPLLLQPCNITLLDLSTSVNSSKRQIAILTGLFVIKLRDMF